MDQNKVTETLGTTKFGNDGNIYVLKLYSPTVESTGIEQN